MTSATQSSSSSVRAAEESTVRQLQSEGWRVVADPAPEQLPDSLAPFQPHLIAQRGDEHAVVEIKSRRQPPDLDTISLADRIAEIPGWRLHLVYVPDEAASVGREQLLGWAASADELAETAPEAALLLCWAAIEGLMHQLGEQRGVDTDQPGRLLAALASLGVVEHDEHVRIQRALEIRNALAHGRQGPVVDRSTVRQLASVAVTLADRFAARDLDLAKGGAGRRAAER